MHTLPKAFEERIKKQLLEEADVFFKALQTKSPTSIRLNLKKLSSPDNLFTDAQLENKNGIKKINTITQHNDLHRS